MVSQFSTMISQLRRHRGISQKQAAMDLGVSQSLLSHYEKGIRECGNDFVIKAADYYGVSCDYILGKGTEEEEEMVLAANQNLSHSTSSDVSIMSSIKAYNQLMREVRSGNPNDLLYFHRYMSMCVYRIINYAAASGYVPENWTEGKNIGNVRGYDATISALIDQCLSEIKAKDIRPADEVPQSVSFISDKCESAVKSSVLRTLEKL